MAKPVFRTIWILFSPFWKTSSAMFPHTMMPLMYCTCSGALPFSQCSLDQPMANGGALIPTLEQSVPGVLHAPPVWPALYCQRNGKKCISNISGATTLLPLTPVHTKVPAYLAQWHSVVVWLHSGHDSPLSIDHIGLLKGEQVLLTTPWLSNSQIISWTEVTESWSAQYCWQCTAVHSSVIGTCCFLTLRRVLWETRQGIQLSTSLCLHNIYPKSSTLPFWVLR